MTTEQKITIAAICLIGIIIICGIASGGGIF